MKTDILSFPKFHSGYAYIGTAIAAIIAGDILKVPPPLIGWWLGILIGMYAFAPGRKLRYYLPFLALFKIVIVAILMGHQVGIILAASALLLAGAFFVAGADFVISLAGDERSQSTARNMIFMFLIFVAFNTLIVSAVGVVVS